MEKFHGVQISAIGTCVPDRVLTNEELERMVDTSDEWIVQRTGIKERRVAGEEEYAGDLCAGAVENMRERYGVRLEDVDAIIVCTTTPDYAFPSVAAQIQAKFRIRQAAAFDLNAACAGFVYGLQVANGLIASGMYRKVLVAAAETLSKVTDYTDRTTCILFGDGAGAVLVERTDGPTAFLSAYADSDGTGGIHVYRSGLSRKLGTTELHGDGRIVQNGREVYKWAVTTVPRGMQSLLKRAGVPLTDVDWFVPHSANLRMIESICERSGMPLTRTLYSLVNYGNTSAATIPLAIDLGIRDGRVNPGNLLLLYGFGAGLVEAGLLVRWTAQPR